MRPPSNLRVRFALWTTALFLAAIVLYGLFVFATMSAFARASVRDSLRVAADRLVATLQVESGEIVIPERLIEMPQGDQHGELLTASLLDPQGRILRREGRYVDFLPPIPPALDRPAFTSGADPDVCVYSAPIFEDGAKLGFIQVAQSTESLERMLGELIVVLGASLPFFIAGSAASGYFLATRLLKPIDLMTRTARRFSEEDLSARINLPKADDELGRLAATFDEMLERIEDSFKRYRQFTADASHELRTPVSVIQAILSVTNRRPRTVEEYKGAMADLGAAADRLESLVSALLTLSRSDMDAAVSASRIDASDLLIGTVESLRPLAEGKGLALGYDIPAGLEIRGDGDALIHVFVNVIDNAIKYTERGGVSVRASSTDEAMEIEVRDSGIGIEEGELPRIFDRFYRVERSRSAGGSGLGLSIARAIVERHRGSIEAESEFGIGTTIRIRLPKA